MRILTTICAVALSVCGTLSAQTITDTLRVRFSTPVTVGDTVVPAGDCKVQIVRGSTSSSTLIVRSESGVTAQALVARVNHTAADESHSHVVVRHNGSGYMLGQIWLENGTGFEILGLSQ